MKPIPKTLWAMAIVFALTLSAFAIRGWIASREGSAEEMLALLLRDMPADSSAVLYADVAQVRQAAFAQKLFAWAPQPQADADYARFVQETGFDYARDLRRIAFSAAQRGSQPIWFAIFDGDFNQQKIAAYLAKNGTLQRHGKNDIYSIPTITTGAPSSSGGAPGSPSPVNSSNPVSHVSLTFLRSGRIAATNDAAVSAYLEQKNPAADPAPWQTRFTRLAGSPIFVVVRRDSASMTALNTPALKGFESPQLSALLAQLSWITVAAQPDKDSLRLVAEGESPVDTAARQLADMLNGVVLLAQLGLNDAKTRQQLDPRAREAYLALLKTAAIDQVDRQETKAVRVVLEINPNFLAAASLPSSAAAPPQVAPSPALTTPAHQHKAK
jgi:hypothetical protein